MGPDDIDGMLGDGERGRRALMDLLLPIVQVEVGYMLIDHARAERRDHAQDAPDFVQIVFMHLFERDARVLRDWDPALGDSLRSYVQRFTRRRVIDEFRRRERARRRERSIEHATGALHPEASDVETRVVAGALLDRLLFELDERLDPRGRRLFRLLEIEERSVSEVAEIMNMTPAAVSAWRTRLRKLAGRILEELETEPP